MHLKNVENRKNVILSIFENKNEIKLFDETDGTKNIFRKWSMQNLE